MKLRIGVGVLLLGVGLVGYMAFGTERTNAPPSKESSRPSTVEKVEASRGLPVQESATITEGTLVTEEEAPEVYQAFREHIAGGERTVPVKAATTEGAPNVQIAAEVARLTDRLRASPNSFTKEGIVQQFNAITEALATGVTPQTGSDKVSYSIDFDDSGDISEVIVLVNNGVEANLMMGVPDGNGGFELAVHIVTSAEKHRVLTFTGAFAESMEIANADPGTDAVGGVASLVGCYSFQDGRKIRIVCVCVRSGPPYDYYICYDTLWI